MRIRNQTVCRVFDTATNLDYSTGDKLVPYVDRAMSLTELRMNVLRISSTSTSSPKVLRIRQESFYEEVTDLLDVVVFWQ